MLIGHRGIPALKNENTLSGFRTALAHKCKLIEFDIRKTKDNVPVCIHDSTLERTTTGSGGVKDFTLSEIKDLSIRGSDEKIPTLDEIFAEFGNGCGYDIEIKTRGTAPLIVEAIQKSGISYDNCLVTSFQWSEINAVRQLDDNIHTGLISFIRPERAIRECVKRGCPVAVLNHRVITRDVVKYAAERDVDIYAFTVNDSQMIKRLRNYGVTAIITDDVSLHDCA
jgi:glycerophosphoryl diester phosphodiesterase